MKKAILAVCVVLLAGALQSQVSDRIPFLGSRPDFLLAATMAMGLVLDPALGAAFGFAAGLTHASIAGASLGGIILSRTLLGFAASSVRARIFQDNPLVLFALALVGTIYCEGVYFLVDPTRSSMAALSQLPMESAYNAVLTVVCYLLVKGTMRRGRDVEPSGLRQTR